MGILNTEEVFLCTLHFADDRVVISQDKDAEHMGKMLWEEYQNCGLALNMDKTKYLCVGEPTEDVNVQVCEEYVYLVV